MNRPWFLILALIHFTSANHLCLHLVKISSSKDLAQVDFSGDPILLLERNYFNHQDQLALHVSCIYGTIFESNAMELDHFLMDFQNLRIALKLYVEIYANLKKDEIRFLYNIHRSFDIILRDGSHSPPPLTTNNISVTLYDLWPYYHLGPSGPRGIDRALIETLSKKLEFSFDIMPPALSVNARELSNGTVVGIIPDVQNGKADIAVCQLALTHQRYQIVDYAPVLSEHDVALVGPVAKPKSAYEALILPFDNWIWLCLGLSLAGVFFILAFFKSCSSPERSVSSNLIESFYLAIAPLIEESMLTSHFRAKGFISMYCFLYMWLVMGLLLALAYKSTLLATMTMVNYNGVIDTPEEVLSSGLPVYVMSQSLIESALVESPRKIYRDIYDNNTAPFGTAFPLGMTPSDMTDNVDMGKAFMASTRTTIMKETKYVTFPDSIYRGATSWVGPKGSRFVKMISDPIMRLQAGGIVDQWFQNELLIVLKHRDLAQAQARHQPINLGHMTPPFILLVIGLTLCFALFVGEICCHPKQFKP